MLDLLDQPFNVVHELYRNAFLTAQAQAEKEEKERKEREAKEREEERQARIHGGRRPGSPVSSIPKKSPQQVQTPSLTPEQRAAVARADGLAMDGLEEVFEEGF